MNTILNATSTATTNFTANIFTRGLNFVWDHSAGYLINFEDNYETLKEKAVDLKSLRDHVMAQIERDEANHLTRIPMVGDWVRRVDESLPEVNTILQDASRRIELGCVANCSFRNWWRWYMLGKEVSMKLETVNGFISDGNNFTVFADRSSPIQVQVVPENPTVGVDELFQEVWSLLGQEDVKIMGIYGMGGVGKTTLLKKINNSLPLEVLQKKLVIWVVVSREFSVERVQKEIGKRLGLVWSEGDGQNERRDGIFSTLWGRKFVVLLDDLWHRMELGDVGIPHPHTLNNGSKVVFTTRSEEVCAAMDADKRVKVPLLNWHHAWTLFQQKLNREDLISRPELQELAEEIAKECGRLPLALVTVARAMSAKETPEEWKHARNTLKQYASKFSGMEDQVLAPLKFSYDSLENDTVRNCLLYCSLYPEDFYIDKDDIVEHWIGEGFLDEMQNWDETRAWGHYIIGSLKAACLLESEGYTGRIKMHDVVRDMALWIAAREEGKKQNRILVQARGSTQAPDIKLWEDAERVSLIYSRISKLSKPPKSPYLLTLLIQYSSSLSSITPDFFQYMPVLTVLNLSDTSIREIPESIGHLAELQFLCLSYTDIETVPDELANLTKLRILDLSYTRYLKKIPRGVMAQLSSLQSLDLYDTTRIDCSQIMEEFESLEDLRELHITIHDFLDQSSLRLSQRLKSCLKSMSIQRSLCLTHFQLVPLLLLRNIEGLKRIAIKKCPELKELQIDCANPDQNNTVLLSSLEQLDLRSLPKLKFVWTKGTTTHHHFKNLSTVSIHKCGALKEMSWLVLVPFLRRLWIINCKEIEEILVDEVFARASDKNQSIFSRLERVYFLDLQKLQSISRVALPFPSLVVMEVFGCPLLKKLPFTSNSTKKSSLRILGKTEWWNKLEWEDETVKTSFQSSFNRSRI